jgi:hypothetical protein
MLRFADRMFYKVTENKIFLKKMNNFLYRIGGIQLHLPLIIEHGMLLYTIGSMHMFTKKFIW